MPLPLPSFLRLLRCVVVLAAAVLPPLWAADGIRAAQRAGIDAEMRSVSARFATEEAACADRFAVTACVDETRQRRRDALAPLRARILALDDAERAERAAARLQLIEGKRSAAALQPAPPPLEVRTPLPRTGPASSAARRRGDDAAQRQQAAGEEAARRAAASAQRREQVQEDVARIQARQAERAREGPAAAPLPVPAASTPR